MKCEKSSFWYRVPCYYARVDDEPAYVQTLRRLLSKHGVKKAVADSTSIPYHTLKGIAAGRRTTPERLDEIAKALGKQIVIADQ